MQGSPYIFAIQDKDFRFWKLDAQGMVICDAQPYFIDLSPAGFQSIEVDNKRNTKYWGLDRTVIAGLGFAGDGAKILKHIWTTLGVNEETYLVIGGQRLYFEPQVNGILTFTRGQSPLTPNEITDGTITGTPGSTVHIKMSLNDPSPPDDYLQGGFGTFNFIHTGFTQTPPITLLPDVIYPVVIPPSGVLPFLVFFFQGVGSASTAQLTLVNENSQEPGYFFWYKQVSRTQIDWTTYNHSTAKVTTNTLEDGFIRYLKARENIVRELPLDVLQHIKIKMDGIILHNIVDNFVNNGGSATGDPNFEFGNHLVDLKITKEDAPYVSGKKQVDRLKVGNHNPTIKTTQAWFLQSTTDNVVNIRWDFWVNITYFPPPDISPPGTYHILVRKINPAGVGSNPLILLQISAAQVATGGGHNWHVVGSGNVNVIAGDELYLYAFFTTQGATGDSQIRTMYLDTIEPSFFNYTYKYRQATTYIPARRPADIFAEHVNLLSDGRFEADTSGLLTTEEDKVFTSGNGLRQIEGAKIKQSFTDFFKFWDTYMDVGLTVLPNGKVTMKRKVDMVDYGDVVDLGQVSNLTVITAIDYLFNRIKIGWPDKQQEGLNGKEAFCNTYEWSVEKILFTDKELDKTCNTVTDCYSADLTRVNFDNKDTTDSRQDNDNYGLHIEKVVIPATVDIPAHYKLDRALNPTATGLLEPGTIFNLGLSPKRCFENNGGWFHSCLDLMETKSIKFDTASRNDKVVAGGLVEKADVLISTLAPQYFRPVYLEFDTAGTFELLELLDANPARLFKFTIDGFEYVVLPDRLSVTPAIGKKKRFKMLCGAGTDLTPLIDFYG